MEVNGQTQ